MERNVCFLLNNQKTIPIPRFQHVLQEFYQDWIGPGRRDVLRYWLEYGMKKPRSISQLDHSEQLEELASLHNELDGTHPEIDEDTKNKSFLQFTLKNSAPSMPNLLTTSILI